MEEIKDPSLINDLRTRGIGYEEGGHYYVSDLEAAYLTEIGKADFEETLRRLKDDIRYRLFVYLRKNMYVSNYVEKDDIFLVYEKGMVPKRPQSKYVMKIFEGDTPLSTLLEWMEHARRVRKEFYVVLPTGDGFRFLKLSEKTFR